MQNYVILLDLEKLSTEFINLYIAFLFPHSLYFYVHGMLASQLVHPLALARRAERMTYSCFQRNRGRRLGAPVVRATAAQSLAAVRGTRNRPRVGYHADDGSS